MSAEHRSKFVALHRQWSRLHMSKNQVTQKRKKINTIFPLPNPMDYTLVNKWINQTKMSKFNRNSSFYLRVCEDKTALSNYMMYDKCRSVDNECVWYDRFSRHVQKNPN